MGNRGWRVVERKGREVELDSKCLLYSLASENHIGLHNSAHMAALAPMANTWEPATTHKVHGEQKAAGRIGFASCK